MSYLASPKNELPSASVEGRPAASVEDRFEIMVHDVSTGRGKFPIFLKNFGRESADSTPISKVMAIIGSEERDHFCSLGYNWPGKYRHYFFYQGVPLKPHLLLKDYQVENRRPSTTWRAGEKVIPAKLHHYTPPNSLHNPRARITRADTEATEICWNPDPASV
jgi:hypothetical protein